MKKRHYIAILVLINLLVIGVLVGCISRSNDTNSNNQPKQLEFSGEDFRILYPSWTLLEKELVTLDKDIYAIIVMGQPDYIGSRKNQANIRICVCKYTDRWLEIWHITKDLQSDCDDIKSLEQYPKMFLRDFIVIKDDKAALIAANVLVGGAHGTTQVAVITLGNDGKCLLRQLDSSGIMKVEKESNYIKVTGEGKYGTHNLYLENGEFNQEIVPLSQTSPSQAIEAKFIVSSDGTVFASETGNLTIKAGQTIAFVPANEEAKKLFDAGQIYIYSDAWNGPPLTICEANRIKTGNSYTFNKAGLCHFVLKPSDQYNNRVEITFNVMVQP